MKKWIAIAVLLFTAISFFGQGKTVLSERADYTAKRYRVQCKIGCENKKYFILMNLFLGSKNVLKVGDKFHLMSNGNSIMLEVTQDLFDKMGNKGYVSFPIEKDKVELISKGENMLYLLRSDHEPIKLKQYSNSLKSLAKSVLSAMKIVKEAEESGKKIYPSWRD